MGRDEEFSAFVAARWAPLVRAAVLLGCPTDDAEDLAQTTLTRCYASWPKVAGADDRDAYVYRILTNTHKDTHRRRRWREIPHADPPDEATEPDSTRAFDDSHLVEQALGNLSAGQRAVVVLRYYAGLNERQIADALGVPVGTVKSRQSRALARLARDGHLTSPPEMRTP